jgi:molecular chaperone GrpE
VSSWAGFVTHSFLSSAASPNLSSKSGSPGVAAAASEQGQETATEKKSEPVKGVVETASEEEKKGEEDLFSVKDKDKSSPAGGKSLEESEAEFLALLGEREALLEEKEKTIEDLKDKVIRSYAEVQNILDRGRREAESSRKYAVQVVYFSSFFLSACTDSKLACFYGYVTMLFLLCSSKVTRACLQTICDL